MCSVGEELHAAAATGIMMIPCRSCRAQLQKMLSHHDDSAMPHNMHQCKAISACWEQQQAACYSSRWMVGPGHVAVELE
jgi:hypothetical protein